VTSGVPVWRYQYDGIDFHRAFDFISWLICAFTAIFPDISTFPELRAFHSSEIPIVFGTYNSSPFGPPTGPEISLSRYVQDAWVTFARDPQQGLSNFGWPKYNPNTASLVQIGNSDNQTGVIFAHGDSFDGGCQPIVDTLNLVSQLINLLGGLL
jgi:carboxylesterase type B